MGLDRNVGVDIQSEASISFQTSFSGIIMANVSSKTIMWVPMGRRRRVVFGCFVDAF